MAEKRTPSYQDYEEAQWGIDTARNKFAPWLIVHCRRTELFTATATITASAIGDSCWNNVILLAHMESYTGTNTAGGVWPIDSSIYNHRGYLYSITSTTASLVISNPLFGQKSLRHISNNATNYGGHRGGNLYYYMISDEAWISVSEDFTIELSYFMTSYNVYGEFGEYYESSGLIGLVEKSLSISSAYILVYPVFRNFTADDGRRYYRFFFRNSQNTTEFDLTLTSSLSVWYHLAIVRSNNITTIFRQGIPRHSFGNAGSYKIGTVSFGCRYVDTNLPFNGYIDEARITIGCARYSGTYSLATSPFPETL